MTASAGNANAAAGAPYWLLNVAELQTSDSCRRCVLCSSVCLQGRPAAAAANKRRSAVLLQVSCCCPRRRLAAHAGSDQSVLQSIKPSTDAEIDPESFSKHPDQMEKKMLNRSQGRSRTIKNNLAKVIWVECTCLGFLCTLEVLLLLCPDQPGAQQSKATTTIQQSHKMQSAVLRPYKCSCMGPLPVRHLARHPAHIAAPSKGRRQQTSCADPAEQPGETAPSRPDLQQQQQQPGVPRAPRKERDLVIPIAVAISLAGYALIALIGLLDSY